MKLKETKIKITSILLLIGLLIGATNCKEDKKDDLTPLLALAAVSGQTVDLPQPANNTGILKLGDQTILLTNLQICISGLGGIGIGQSVLTPLPALSIHNIDFSKTSGITLGAGGSALDIDTTNGVYGVGKNGVQGSCPATVKETSATTYDLQAINCPITKQFAAHNIPDVNLSFRVRCTKQ